MRRIAEVLDPAGEQFERSVIRDVIRQRVWSTVADIEERALQDYIGACRFISEAMPLAPSIDNFLHTHRDCEMITFCGKLGIAVSILQAESNSKLYREPSIMVRPEPIDLPHTWHTFLWRSLSAGVHKNAVDEMFKNVSFIVFNYDRCVEQFLWLALHFYFGLEQGAAESIVRDVAIYHPYGTLGRFRPEQGLALPALSLPFGSSSSFEAVSSSVSRIRTFTESMQDEHELPRIHAAIAEADKLVFVGFGFLDLNMALLAPRRPVRATRVYGTRRGISDTDIGFLTSAIYNMLRVALPSAADDPASMQLVSDHNARLESVLRVELQDVKACRLFAQNSRSLAS